MPHHLFPHCPTSYLLIIALLIIIAAYSTAIIFRLDSIKMNKILTGWSPWTVNMIQSTHSWHQWKKLFCHNGAFLEHVGDATRHVKDVPTQQKILKLCEGQICWGVHKGFDTCKLEEDSSPFNFCKQYFCCKISRQEPLQKTQFFE